MPILIIGYGNTLRSDDGAGQIVATQIAQWNLPQVRSLAVHQLTPELADDIRQAAQVIFVDATVIPLEQPQLRQLEQLSPEVTNNSWGHSCNPRSLLEMAQALYGQAPPGYLMLIPGINFDFGEELSSITQTAIELALKQIKEIVITSF